MKLLARTAMADIFSRPLPSLVEQLAKGFEIVDGIGAPPVGRWLRPVSFSDDLAEIALVYADELRRFG